MLRSAVQICVRKMPEVGKTNLRKHIRLEGNLHTTEAEGNQIAKFPLQAFAKPVLGHNVEVRTALLSDYDSVISIIQNGLHKKFDSLADRYCAYISSPTSTGYIANVNGEDVGFLLTHLIDDGSNIVLDEFRSKVGTDEKAKEAVIRHVFDSLNSKTRTVNQSSESGSLSDLMHGARCCKVATKIRSTFYSSVPDLLQQLRYKGVQLQSVSRLTKCDFRKLIRDQRLPLTLLNNTRILKSGVLYRRILQNVDLLMDKRTLILTTNMKNTDLSLISFGTYSYTTNGLHCNLSFHGNMEHSLDEHVSLHMISLLNRGIGLISFQIFSDSQEDKKLIESTVKNFNVHATESDTVTWYESRML